MAQVERALATNSDEPSLIPGNKVTGGKDQNGLT